tara:strand:+ start:162 stop:488 length:327 start_codon:yes stop_codon:yes gene_type:complete
MANLFSKIKIYLKENSKNISDEIYNFTLIDKDSGAFIESWNVNGITKPTDKQLNSYDTEANKDEANMKVIDTRRKAYGDIGEQLDEIYKDIDAWKTRIKKVKDDNPKE